MRYVLLDCLHIVAIGLVLIAHIGQALGSPVGNGFGFSGFYFVSLGGIGVTIFLILSGAALELRYRHRKISYFDFIIRRFLRIYSVYYMSLIIGVTVYLFLNHKEGGPLFSTLSNFGLRDIILSLTGFYAFAGKWGGPFIATSWFIGLIITMYLAYPILAKMIRKKPATSIAILLLVSVLSRLILGKYEILPARPLDWFPLCRIFEFSLGIYLVTALKKDYWSVLNFVNARTSKIIRFAAETSFPLFLIHSPLSFIIYSLIQRGVNQVFAVLFFIVVSVALSMFVLHIDKLIRGTVTKT